jgi:hypothetical protein
MAILDSLEILLEDATSKQAIPEFDTEKTSAETTVRQVVKCIGMVDGQQFRLKIRALPTFEWFEGYCLRKF